MKTLVVILVAFANFGGLNGLAMAGPLKQHQKVLASDGAAGDAFGQSMSISGDRALIGASLDGDNGLLSGSAYMYERQANGKWTQVQKLVASDGAPADYFGHSVSLSGDYALIGAPASDAVGLDSGAAYVFERQATGSWTQVQKLTASDGEALDGFGQSVAVSGDRALIGAVKDDDMGFDSGAAYVFRRLASGGWSQGQKLLMSNPSARASCGQSVALSGEYALLGAPADPALLLPGAAYVFRRQFGSTWLQVAKLSPPNGGVKSRFGWSVALSGERALVGEYANDVKATDAGAAFIFEKIGPYWHPVEHLFATDAAANDGFGYSVSLSGDRALVGARADDDKGADSGSAYLFERQDQHTWPQMQKLIPSDGAAGDAFGSNVFLTGDRAVVAATTDDDNGLNSGSAYGFDVITCAPSLGYQGLGNMKTWICGDDLTLAGSTATFLVNQAPPNSIALLFAGLSFNPTPIAGAAGMLVPVPVLAGFPLFLPTDADGSSAFPVNGGANTPVTLYLQVLAPNGAIVEFSNAVQLAIGL